MGDFHGEIMWWREFERGFLLSNPLSNSLQHILHLGNPHWKSPIGIFPSWRELREGIFPMEIPKEKSPFKFPSSHYLPMEIPHGNPFATWSFVLIYYTEGMSRSFYWAWTRTCWTRWHFHTFARWERGFSCPGSRSALAPCSARLGECIPSSPMFSSTRRYAFLMRWLMNESC